MELDRPNTKHSSPLGPRGISRSRHRRISIGPLHWAMGLEGIFLNTVGDIALLSKVLDAASRFESRPDDDTMHEMLETRRMTSLFGIG